MNGVHALADLVFLAVLLGLARFGFSVYEHHMDHRVLPSCTPDMDTRKLTDEMGRVLR